MITGQAPEGRIRKAATAVALAGLVIAGACEAPTPSEVVETNAESLVTPSLDVNTPAKIRIRGSSLEEGKVQPLVYIDGVRMNDYATSRLKEVNPNDIESIEVMKGAAAIERFGEAATGGVLYITLKKKSAPQGSN